GSSGLLLGGGLEGPLGLADLEQGGLVDDVGDGAHGAVRAVLAGGLAPAGGLEAALLAEQGEEDLRLLFPEPGQLLEAAQDLRAVGVAVGPDAGGVAVVVGHDGGAER